MNAHRVAVDRDDIDCGAGRRATRRNAVRAQPAAEARTAMLAGATAGAHLHKTVMTEAAVMGPNDQVERRAAPTLAM
jgi:hypothetical protein